MGQRSLLGSNIVIVATGITVVSDDLLLQCNDPATMNPCHGAESIPLI